MGSFVSLASVTKSILNIKGHCLNGLVQAVLCLPFPAGGSFLDCALFFPSFTEHQISKVPLPEWRSSMCLRSPVEYPSGKQ